MVTRLILSTGDTLAPETAALLEEAKVPTLVKPFDFAQLEALVREIAACAKTSGSDAARDRSARRRSGSTPA